MNEDQTPATSAPGTEWAGRATHAVIDLDALAGNVKFLLATLSPGTELMAVVKANGYGHGASMVARAALAAGAQRLAVATVGEGRQLRSAGVTAPVLVLSPVVPGEVAVALRHDLELTVATDSLLDAVIAASGTLPAPASIHVKIDTGMRRYGTAPAAAAALARRVWATPSLRLAGVLTHFAAADEADERFTIEQAARFDRFLEELTTAGIRPGHTHAANSAAVLRSRRYDYDLVRVGIALYGLPPATTSALPPGLRPVMTLKSRIGRIIALDAGDTVGYGRTYRSPDAGRAALVPIGYADGYRRALSDRAWMGIRGRRAPVIGRVSMDQTVVRLAPETDVAAGDEVVIAGSAAADAAPSLVALADLLDTIPYEVVTGITTRVPRLYLQDGEVIAVDDEGASP